MESKEFWEKLLEEANNRMPKEYQLIMSDPGKEDADELPEGCEAKVFNVTWKDGKTYGKGWYFHKDQINDDNWQSTGFMLAMSFTNVFENLEEDIANGKTTQDN